MRLHIDVLHSDDELIYEDFVGELPVKGEKFHIHEVGTYQVWNRTVSMDPSKKRTTEVSLKVVVED